MTVLQAPRNHDNPRDQVVLGFRSTLIVSCRVGGVFGMLNMTKVL